MRDDEMIDNSERMSKALNDYFLSVFTHENLTTLPGADQVFKEREDERLTNIDITSQQVIQEINKLKINTLQGIDEVFPSVLYEFSYTINVALSNMFNKSITSGDVPSL